MVQIFVGILMFLMNVGKTPMDLKEFAKIQGEWQVVKVEKYGKAAPEGEFPTKTLLIGRADALKAQPMNSTAFVGRLNTRLKRPTIEMRFISMRSEPPKEDSAKETEKDAPETPPFPPYPPTMYPDAMSVLYEVQGDTLKMLLVKPLRDGEKMPTKVETHENSSDQSLLLVLKRKPKPVVKKSL